MASLCLRIDLASARPACVSEPSRAKKGCTTVWYHNRDRLKDKQKCLFICLSGNKTQIRHIFKFLVYLPALIPK